MGWLTNLSNFGHMTQHTNVPTSSGPQQKELYTGQASHLEANSEAAEVSLRVLEKCTFLFKSMPSSLQHNPDFAKKAVAVNGAILECLPKEFRKDAGIVKIAVEKFGGALAYASQDLRRDPEYVLELLQINPDILPFISHKLFKDKDFTLKAIGINSQAFKYTSDKNKNDMDVVTAAANKDFDLVTHFNSPAIQKVTSDPKYIKYGKFEVSSMRLQTVNDDPSKLKEGESLLKITGIDGKELVSPKMTSLVNTGQDSDFKEVFLISHGPGPDAPEQQVLTSITIRFEARKKMENLFNTIIIPTYEVVGDEHHGADSTFAFNGDTKALEVINILVDHGEFSGDALDKIKDVREEIEKRIQTRVDQETKKEMNDINKVINSAKEAILKEVGKFEKIIEKQAKSIAPGDFSLLSETTGPTEGRWEFDSKSKNSGFSKIEVYLGGLGDARAFSQEFVMTLDCKPKDLEKVKNLFSHLNLSDDGQLNSVSIVGDVSVSKGLEIIKQMGNKFSGEALTEFSKMQKQISEKLESDYKGIDPIHQEAAKFDRIQKNKKTIAEQKATNQLLRKLGNEPKVQSSNRFEALRDVTDEGKIKKRKKK